eukprot:5633959-Pyramimonas_sp.AAC.1
MGPHPDPSWTAGNNLRPKAVANGRVLSTDLGALPSTGLQSCQCMASSSTVASCAAYPSALVAL